MPVSNRKAKFELRQEHIDLAADVNFKPRAWWDDGRPDSLEFFPEICPKRPFGNSGVTYDVAQRLGLLTPTPGTEDDEDPELEMTRTAERQAMKVLIEMPVALETILREKTFQPGTYEIDMLSAYFMYREYLCAWFWLDAIRACAKITRPGQPDMMERAFSFCRSTTGWNPYDVIRKMTEWSHGSDMTSPVWDMLKVFRDDALRRFRANHPDEAKTPDRVVINLLIHDGDPSDKTWPFWKEQP